MLSQHVDFAERSAVQTPALMVMLAVALFCSHVHFLSPSLSGELGAES